MTVAAVPSMVVAASGRGSNFEALMRAVSEGRLDARVVGVVTDQPGAGVLEKAAAWGIPSVVVPVVRSAGQSVHECRVAHEQKILEAIRPWEARFLVLAGYMRIITPTLLRAFGSGQGYSRIVNIHPSLLPSFPGLHGYAQAFHHGAKVTGVTVHLLPETEAEVDTGPICAQEAFSIADCDSEEEVERKGLAVEHRLYPETLQWILNDKFEVVQRVHRGNRRTCVCPH